MSDADLQAVQNEAAEIAGQLSAVWEELGIGDCFPMVRGDLNRDLVGVISLGRPTVQQARKIITTLKALHSGDQVQS